MGFRFRRRVAFGRQLRPIGPLRQWRWRREAAFQGRRDGKLGEPQNSYTRVMGERDVFKQHGDAVLRKIKGAWQRNDALWQAHVLSCEAERLQRTQDGTALSALVAEKQVVVDERAAELEVRLKAERSRGAAERWHIARWIYVLALPCIFAGEIFINAFAFDVLGAVTQNMKYAVAGAISLAVVICAHAVGTLLKTGDITSRERWVLRAALWFPLGLLVALSVLRVMAFKQLDIGSDFGLSLGPSAGGDSGGSQTNAVIESAVFAVINIVMFIAACVLSFFAYDAYDDAARRARASYRHARFARWRVSRRWQRTVKRQLKSAYRVNSGIARAQGDFAAASTASRMYKDFFEELDARYLRANLRARARKQQRLLSRARDTLVAQQRHGGETDSGRASYDAAPAVLVKPELADEMSKEKQPSWHRSMWVQAASTQDDAALEHKTNGHVAAATLTKRPRHTTRRTPAERNGAA